MVNIFLSIIFFIPFRFTIKQKSWGFIDTMCEILHLPDDHFPLHKGELFLRRLPLHQLICSCTALVPTRMLSRSCGIARGSFVYTLPFRKPHKKK